MSRKRYGGFSDPEPEASNEVITEPEVVKEVITEPEASNEVITEPEASNEVVTEPEASNEVTAEIEEATEPVTFDEEKSAEPITEPMEPIEAEVGEEKELEVTPTTPNLPYKITIAINALNIRTGPGSSYQAVGITKKGSVHKVLEEQDGWGRIGDNKWINLSKRFVEKD